MTEGAGAEDFIADAERHNAWWSEDGGRDVKDAMGLTPRSDFHEVIKIVDQRRKEGVETLVYPIYGQTGIGKTTLLYQLVAALIDEIDYAPTDEDLDVVSSVSPRQVLYVPLEESLYHLEPPAGRIDRLERVVDYFRTHIAPRHGPTYVILDDVDALDPDEEVKRALLDIIEDDTYLFLTGIVSSQVELGEVSGADEIETVRGPLPILPMKFADTIGHPEAEGGLHVDVGAEFREQLERYRSDRLPGPSPIKDVRDRLGLSGDDFEVNSAVEAIDSIYFDVFDPDERDALHDAAREYLRKGGILHRTEDTSIRNELTKAHFLLYLYKELATYGSIQKPENLHRLSSIAASSAGEELQYTEISDRIGVDRRTVDTYLDVLDDGIAVTESHDFSLRRYRRTRLFLRNPRHVVLLSQRQEHYGYESYDPQNVLNHEFEYKLARTVAFDHAMRLAYEVGAYEVEYCPTGAGLVDYVLHRDGNVLPFVLSYHPHTEDPEAIAAAFDPSVGQHTETDSEELRDLEYDAPYRFVITDSLPKELDENGSLVVDTDGAQICYIPYWLFLLLC